MKISHLLSLSNKSIPRVSPGACVLEALQILQKCREGALVVMEGELLLGLFSERDYIARVILKHLDPYNTVVSDVMTTNVETARPEDEVESCLQKMTQKNFRHIPIMQEGKMVGFFNILEINGAILETKNQILQNLEDYAAKTWPI